MRNRIYNVITPLNRFENLRKLISVLENQDCIWNVITDDNVPFGLYFKQPWIRHYVCPNRQETFFLRCNWAINWFLDSYPLRQNERFMFLNDDDLLEPGYFDKVDKFDGEVVITSMKRGDHIPVGVQAERAHGTTTLIAQKENMVIGGVGVEQILMSGKILKDVRIPMEISGDGRMIEWVVNTHGAEYCPEAFVWFNALEPGRWDSLPE